jgi:hypothetical protein
MSSSRTAFVLSALLTICLLATSTVRAQTSSKPLFTAYPPHLCVAGGFVAMAGISRRNPLVVIPIDVNGIEPPQTIPSVGDEVLGMLCSNSQIELLVRDYESNRLIISLYAVQWHSGNPTTIHEEQPEELNLPKAGPTPPAVVFRKGSLEWQGRSWAGARGDWYVWVPQVVDRPNNTYEVHFVSTHGKHCGKLVVTLLEETLDKKVTRSVPLVYIEACSD